MPRISKRLADLAGKIEDRAYAPLDAIALVKDNANAKFDETMEAHARLGIESTAHRSHHTPAVRALL